MSELAKTVIDDDGQVNAPRDRQSWKSLWDPKTLSNTARNGQESAKIVSVDDRHVNTPQGLLIVEITSGPENGE